MKWKKNLSLCYQTTKKPTNKWENYLKWLTFKGRINAHVPPRLHVTQVCTPHHDSQGQMQHQETAESKKQSNKDQREGMFSHLLDKYSKPSTKEKGREKQKARETNSFKRKSSENLVER